MRLRYSYLGPALLLLLSNQGSLVTAQASGSAGGLYPPGLLPIINKANAFLSTGQFGEAAKAYGEAIEQSPADYLLYYKRATAYLSLQRHQAALDDFEKVLSLTHSTFDNAHLQKARIYLKEGEFSEARHSLSAYLKAKKGVRGPDVEELEKDIEEGSKLKDKTEKERRSQLWTSCVETASQALRHASHSHELRVWRAECALASGDVESSVGDLTRLSHLLSPSTELLTHIFRLSYFLLPHSSASTPKETLKQCLHFDPDSKPCLVLHRLMKKLDRGFTQLDQLLAKEDWKGIIKLLVGGGKNGELYKSYEEAMKENMITDKVLPLVPPKLLHATPPKKKSKTMPEIHLPDASKSSPTIQHLVRSLCKSYTHLADVVKSKIEYKEKRKEYCTLLLSLSDCSDDADGLAGKAESLLSELEPNFEEAVRLLGRAFEKSGRNEKIHTRLAAAQKRLKASKNKDYYKILGVPRDADEDTIKKAYRKAAKSAHPDKGGSEAKMAELNEAREVLSDLEKRAAFDRGDDPMDPQSQGGSPFPGGDPYAQFFAGGGGRRRPFAGPGGFQYQYGGDGGFPGGQFHFSHGF